MMPQVVDPLVGWTEFREGYLTPTWEFLSAALLPRFIMASATISESSLLRISGALRPPETQIVFIIEILDTVPLDE